MSETATATISTPDPSPAAMAVYRATAQRRAAETARALASRRARAQEVARQAAMLLKEQFGATQVVVFGSTVHGHWFTATSDIDLAARGLAPDDYFTAVARLQDLSPEFKVDLVAVERCKAALCESIAREGVIL
ncbi:MAG: nucleotidyltransferase domain-containing protein [Anaerolineae bacterium]